MKVLVETIVNCELKDTPKVTLRFVTEKLEAEQGPSRVTLDVR